MEGNNSVQFDDWSVTANRYVAFLDIMGFKDLVARSTHNEVLKKLNTFTEIREFLARSKEKYKLEDIHFTTFSDSIIVFSKNATEANRIIFLRFLRYVISTSLVDGIPIKGACAFGQVTVDIKNQLYFGQALIDAYMLQEEVYYYGITAHNSFESKCNVNLYEKNEIMKYIFIAQTPLKNGNITHLNIDWFSMGEDDRPRESVIKILSELSKGMSGRPRKYVDNTLQVYKHYLSEKEDKK